MSNLLSKYNSVNIIVISRLFALYHMDDRLSRTESYNIFKTGMMSGETKSEF